MIELSNVICLFIAVSIVAFIYYFFVKDKLLNAEESNAEESNVEESNEKGVTFSDEVEEKYFLLTFLLGSFFFIKPIRTSFIFSPI